MSKMQVDTASRLQDRTPSPPTKRIRRPLNFSIESIMQPSQQQQQPTGAAAAASALLLDGSRSPSPGSEADSRCGPRSSSGGPSSNSSRASSPISPGGGVECANDTTHQTSGNHHQSNQRDALHQDFLKQDFTSNQRNPLNNSSNQLAGTSSKPAQIKSSLTKSSRSGHKSSNPTLRPVCTDQRLAPFECHLDNPNLWHSFHELDTEMIITKQGRRMFPPVKVTFSFNDQLLHHQQQQQQAPGCNQPPQLQFNSRDKYQVLMDILPYDGKRYRYAYHKSSWQGAGKADPPSPTKLFLHPDGPFTLDQLKRQVISFEKIKLTNNDGNKHGYIVLNSMHKYQPRIHLILWRGKESQNLANGPVSLLDQEAHKTFIFSETVFTAVTAYQNHSITKLKIDSNPFAKGFRDSTRLTDLELESMHDLIADGQCPFSPPRAPPAGFPHFLFAAAAQQHHHHHNNHLQQQSHTTPYSNNSNNGNNNQTFAPVGLPPGLSLPLPPPPPPPYHFTEPSGGGAGGNLQLGPPGDEAALALFRDRTLMAFDSLFQQQQQQSSSSVSPQQLANAAAAAAAAGRTSASMSPRSRQEQLRSSSSESANGSGQQVCNQGNNAMQQQQSRPPVSEHPFNPAHFAKALLASGQSSSALMGALPGPPPPPPTSKAALVSQSQLEQFILQQQQFAAAMAAAAASGVHGHQHPAAYQLQSLFAQAVQQQQQQQQQKSHQAPPPVGSTSPVGARKLDSTSSPPVGRQVAPLNHMLSNSQEQTSPIGMAKSANRQLQLDLNQFLGHQQHLNQHNHHHHHHHQQQQQPQNPQPATGMNNANGAQNHQEHINQQQTIQAIMQHQHQQHMQQMAALAHGHHQAAHLQPNQAGGGGGCLQMEPLLGLQDAGLGSRRAAAKTHNEDQSIKPKQSAKTTV